VERQDKSKSTGSTFGFHFAGLDINETKAVRTRLNDVAYKLGYISRSGPLSGRGNAAALLVAIAKGEVTVIRRERSDGMQQESAM